MTTAAEVGREPAPARLGIIKYTMHDWEEHRAYTSAALKRCRDILETYAYWHQKSLDVATHNYDQLTRLIDLIHDKKNFSWAEFKDQKVRGLEMKLTEGAELGAGGAWDGTAARIKAHMAANPDLEAELEPHIRAALKSDNAREVVEAAYASKLRYYSDRHGYRLVSSNPMAQLATSEPVKKSWPTQRRIALRKPGDRPYTFGELMLERGVRVNGTSKKEVLDAMTKLRDSMLEQEVTAYAGHFNWSRFRGLMRGLGAMTITIGHDEKVGLMDEYDFAHLFPPHQRTSIRTLQKKPGRAAEVIEKLPPAVFSNVELLNSLYAAMNSAYDTLEHHAIHESKEAQDENIYTINRNDSPVTGGARGGIGGAANLLGDALFELMSHPEVMHFMGEEFAKSLEKVRKQGEAPAGS